MNCPHGIPYEHPTDYCPICLQAWTIQCYQQSVAKPSAKRLGESDE